MTGTLRVTMSFDFARDWLAGWLPDLRRRHPELRLELELSQRRVDLVAEDIDVAIRAGGPLPDSGHVARRLVTSDLVFCATPAYLKAHGTPRTVEDLAAHECLALQRPGGSARWRIGGPKGPVDVALHGWLSVNDFGVLHAMVCAGLGIGLCEANTVRSDLRERRLRRVLPDHGVSGGALWAVYPSSRHLSPKVRAFVDFLAEKTGAIG